MSPVSDSPGSGKKRDPLRARVEVRVTDDQLVLLQDAAEADDAGSLSDWARRVLVKAARKQLARRASSNDGGA